MKPYIWKKKQLFYFWLLKQPNILACRSRMGRSEGETNCKGGSWESLKRRRLPLTVLTVGNSSFISHISSSIQQKEMDRKVGRTTSFFTHPSSRAKLVQISPTTWVSGIYLDIYLYIYIYIYIYISLYIYIYLVWMFVRVLNQQTLGGHHLVGFGANMLTQQV